jgi:hypothetical protein
MVIRYLKFIKNFRYDRRSPAKSQQVHHLKWCELAEQDLQPARFSKSAQKIFKI